MRFLKTFDRLIDSFAVSTPAVTQVRVGWEDGYEWLVGMNLEIGGRGLLEGNIPAFVWKC